PAADDGPGRRCPATRPEPTVVLDSIRRPVPLPADPGRDPPGPNPPGGGFPRIGDDPTGVRPAIAPGLEALRHGTPPPCHERGPGSRAGPLRRLERHPQALVPDRV